MSALALIAQAPAPPDSVIEAQKAMEERMIADLPYLSPLGCLVIAALGGIVLALALPASRQAIVAWFVGFWHVALAVSAGLVWALGGFEETMEGTLIVDGMFLASAAIIGVAGVIAVALLRAEVAGSDREGELYAVLSGASLGSVVLAGANDASLLALSVGLIGVCSFVMVGYLRRAARSNEGSLKFYVYGTVAAATMVYGLSLLFGLSGTTDFAMMGSALAQASEVALLIAAALFLVGLGFEASIVPFHFWAPDTYEGAPLSVAAFLSVIPKAAAVVALVRVLPEILPGGLLDWPTAVAVLAAASMIFGTAAMIPQRNAVRLLAYSSISQSGFMLIAVAALDASGQAVPSLLYYLAAYAVANLAAFGVLAAVERETGSVDVAALRGLGRRHPWWTAGLVVSLLSLLGVPPLAGFVAKLEVFTAAIDAGMAWLAVVGILATAVSLYPYMRLIAPATLDADEGRAAAGALRPALAAAVLLATLATVGFGVGAEPFLDVAEQAVALTAGSP